MSDVGGGPAEPGETDVRGRSVVWSSGSLTAAAATRRRGRWLGPVALVALALAGLGAVLMSWSVVRPDAPTTPLWVAPVELSPTAAPASTTARPTVPPTPTPNPLRTPTPTPTPSGPDPSRATASHSPAPGTRPTDDRRRKGRSSHDDRAGTSRADDHGTDDHGSDDRRSDNHGSGDRGSGDRGSGDGQRAERER